MMQWWAIINHVKKLVSDPNATIILSWYVAEGTLWRKLLDIEKQLLNAYNANKIIQIDWEDFEVKCKIESIWWYSSHMWQSDLVEFWWKLLDYSKNAILSLNHWDESREVLKKLMEEVNW
jgi:predicted metal-dependent RNase